MKKLIALFVVLSMFASISFAESPELAEEYVLSQGFTIANVDEYDGAPKCYMLEDNGWQSVAFTTTDTIYGVVAFEEFDMNYRPERLRGLFFDLVQHFDWDVVFYWPNYDTTDKITVSYGIVSDLDKTNANYSNKPEFLNALNVHLYKAQPVNDQIDAANSAIEAYKDAIYENFGFKRDSITAFMEDLFGMPLLTSEFAAPSANICAEYVLGSEFAACRTGVGSEGMLIYAYPEGDNSNTASDSEIWAYYSSLKSYIADNKVSIITDGSLAGADTLSVIIDIITSNSYDRAVYNLITDECIIRSMN